MDSNDPNEDAFPNLAGHDLGALMGASIPSEAGTGTPNPVAWTPPTAEELSEWIPDYRVTSLLGRGGMGAVYRGTQTSLEREVAIKLLPPELAANPEFAARFRREARSMAQLNHPNIVQVYDFGQTDGGHGYIVMEFVEGTDLHQYAAGEKLPVEAALNAVSQICDALQYAHDKGFVHRDIKPANIFLNQEGVLKVGDFGLAKLADLPDGEVRLSPADERGLTMTGIAMGTPDYIAPEQLVDGEGIDRRADLYSLGVMFYQFLTGDLPRGGVKQPSQKIPTLDVRIDGIVYRAMDPDRDSRYQTASEIRTDIDGLTQAPAPEPEKVEPVKPSENLKWILAAVFLAIAVGAGFYFVFPDNKESAVEMPPTSEEVFADEPEPPAPVKVAPFASRELPPLPATFPLSEPSGYGPLPTTKCRFVTIALPEASLGTIAFENAARDDYDDIVRLGDLMRLTNLVAIRDGGQPVIWTWEGGRISPPVKSPALAAFNNSWESPLTWVDEAQHIRTILSSDREGVDQLEGVVRIWLYQNRLFVLTADGQRHFFGDLSHPNASVAFAEPDQIVAMAGNTNDHIDYLTRSGEFFRVSNGEKLPRGKGICHLYDQNFAATSEGFLATTGSSIRLMDHVGQQSVYRANGFGYLNAIQPSSDGPWQIWKETSPFGPWERSTEFESALAHAVEVRVQEGFFVHALIPREKIPRSGLWTLSDLTAHNQSLE